MNCGDIIIDDIVDHYPKCPMENTQSAPVFSLGFQLIKKQIL